MDVISCIVAYEKLSRDVFELKTWRNRVTGAWNWAHGNGWFSAKALEDAIAEILECRLPVDESMNLEGRVRDVSFLDPLHHSCRVYVWIYRIQKTPLLTIEIASFPRWM